MKKIINQRKQESYSSLSLLKQCPYQYKLRYIDGNYKNQESISLDLGNLCHKILELQRNPLTPEVKVDELLSILENGYVPEHLNGVKAIRDKFFDDYMTINQKSGLTYDDKLSNFTQLIKDYKPEEEWEVVATELPFVIPFKGFLLSGKIDRIDVNKNGDYRVVDYKTANAVYKDSDLKTPLQMYIYALAIESQYGKYPIEFLYDFVFLNRKSYAMSKGWEKRGEKALEKLLEERLRCYEDENFYPKPTPLCYYCPYCREECDYYSLWTPSNKTFDVNKKYDSSKKEDTEELWW